MTTLMVQENYVNRTAGYRFGDSKPYAAYTDNRAKLFRMFQHEFGRCGSKVYVDTKEGTKHVGWTFEKKMVYEDCRRNVPLEKDMYIREVWVTLYEVEEDTE